MNPTVYIQHYYRCTPGYTSPPVTGLSSEDSVQFNGALKFYVKAERNAGIYHPYHLNWRIPIDIPL